MIINTLQRRALESAWEGGGGGVVELAISQTHSTFDSTSTPTLTDAGALVIVIARLAPAVIRALRNITGIAEGADGAGVARGVRLRRVLAVRVPQNRVTKL